MIILNNQFEGTSMQFQQRNVVFYGNYVIKKKKKTGKTGSLGTISRFFEIENDIYRENFGEFQDRLKVYFNGILYLGLRVLLWTGQGR